MRRGIVPAVMTSVVLTAAACGTTQDNTGGQHNSASGAEHKSGGDPVRIVQAAYEKTTGSSTARLALTEKIAAHLSGGTDQQITVSGHGLLDFAHKSAELTMSTPKGKLDVRTVNGILYLKLPTSERSVSAGKPWAKIDVNKVAKARTGASVSQLTGPTPTDPSQQLAYLRGVSDQVKKVGVATVGGAKTTHYRATIDLDKAAGQRGVAAQHAITQMEQQLGSHKMPTDVWIDQQGQLRRLVLVEHIRHLQSSTGSASGGSATLTITETLSDFGVNASVSAPPSAQTTDLTAKVLSSSSG